MARTNLVAALRRAWYSTVEGLTNRFEQPACFLRAYRYLLDDNPVMLLLDERESKAIMGHMLLFTDAVFIGRQANKVGCPYFALQDC